MKAQVDLTEADLRRAWRECALVNTTFDDSMKHPALAIAIRRVAENWIRRQQRLLEQQQRDCKRAQANDAYIYE